MTTSTTGLSVFQYADQQVRTIIIDGDPWFVAADVCGVLAHSNSRMAVASLDDDEKGVSIVDTPGGPQQVTIVNESGLYSLILRSRVPGAKEFKRWITHELLPTLRKTGRYGSDVDLLASLPSSKMLALAAEAAKRAEDAEAALVAAAPAIEYVDRFVDKDGVSTIKAWGAQFGLTQPKAFALLLERGLIYSEKVGRRFSKTKNEWVDEIEYRPRSGKTFGYFDARPQHNVGRRHNGQVRRTLYVRQAHAIDLARAAGLADEVMFK